MGYGIGGLIVLILDVYVIYLILNSSAASDRKILWIIVVILLPLIGPILYLLLARG
jgi:hypothetical protein